MFRWLTETTLDHRWAVIAALIMAFLGLASGILYTTADFSVESFFSTSDPAHEAYDRYREYWGPDDDVLLVVVTAGEGDLLDRSRLQLLEEVGSRLEASDAVRQVDSIATAPPIWSDDTGVIDLEPLVDSLPEGAADHAAWRARALTHPLWVPTLLSSDAKTGAMIVETQASSDDMHAVVPVVQDIRDTLAQFEGRGSLTFELAGIPAVRAAFFSRLITDQSVMLPLGGAFIALCLVSIFRSPHGLLIPALAAFLPVVMVFGIMGWFGEPLGIINQTYLTLLPSIAVADAIHLVTRFHEEARREAAPGCPLTPEQRRNAIVRAASAIGRACLLTSLTTGVGFLSLLVAQMPILRTFGLYAAIGIFLAYAGILTFVPLMLTFTRGAGPKIDASSRGDRFLGWCADVSIGRPVSVLGVTAVFVGICLFFGSQVTVDNSLTKTLRDDHPVSLANQVADRELGGIIALELDLQGEPDALKDPEVLRGLLDLEDWAKNEPEFRSASSPASYVAMLYEATLGERGLPETAAGVAQFYLLAEGDRGMDQILSSDYGRGRMMVRAQDRGALAQEALGEKLDLAIDRYLGHTGLDVSVTGTPVVAYRGINNVTTDLRNSLVLAFGIITLMIGLLFRDARLALLCLVPNALPLLTGYALLGAMGWNLDPTPAVIFTVALGIAVDDTLHLLVRMREEMASGLLLRPAIRSAVLHSGRAVGITSLILVGGFGVNILSSFKAMTVLGGVGATVIGTALLCDLFVLPALLSLWGRESVS
jgi:uncharacterized protein